MLIPFFARYARRVDPPCLHERASDGQRSSSSYRCDGESCRAGVILDSQKGEARMEVQRQHRFTGKIKTDRAYLTEIFSD